MGNVKPFFLLPLLCFLTFGNSFNNNLIGDDRSIFLENAFYRDLKNLPRIFSADLVMRPGKSAHEITQQISISGFVSYRPLVAATFFADSFLWREKAFGYHLSNILLHILAGWVVYQFILGLSVNAGLALLAAILFATHPVQAEAVNTAGYRSDILLTILYLSSVIFYLRHRRGKNPVSGNLILSCSFFAAALLSKETAVTLPAFLLLLECGYFRQSFRTFRQAWFAYALIAAAWLFLYLRVMPNAYYPKFPSAELPLWQQAGVNLKILWQYVSALFFPWTTTLLPPLYAPPPQAADTFSIAMALSVIAASAWLMLNWRKFPLAALGLCVFWLNYLPVSNIIPLLNPCAFRFLYLPSVGFFIGLALVIESAVALIQRKFPTMKLGLIFKAAVIGLCISTTVPLNEYFKNDIVAAGEMVRHYPDSSRPYWILGINYLDRREYPKAVENLRRYFAIDPRNPFIPDVRNNFLVYHMLGRAYAEDPDQAVDNFRRAVALKPDFVVGHADLAKALILKEDYPAALSAAQKAVELDARFVLGHVYAIHSYVMLGQLDMARQQLAAVLSWADPQDINLKYLTELIHVQSQSIE